MSDTDGLQCQSHLHSSEKVPFVLMQVAVRQGSANRWITQWWCQRCLEAKRLQDI